VIVDDHQQRRLFAALPHPAHLGAPIEQHAKTAHPSVAPVVVFHLAAVRVDPGHVLHTQLFAVAAIQKEIAPQDRVLVPEAGQLPGVFDQVLPFSFSSQFSQLISLSWQ
jgi:hypothetical protein